MTKILMPLDLQGYTQIFDWIIDLTIWIKWTPQQDMKSNNTAQGDKQHTTTLRWWNHEKKTRSMWNSFIYIEIKRKKDKDGWFQVKNWPKITPQLRN